MGVVPIPIHMSSAQNSQAWSQTAVHYSADSMIKVPEYFATISADLLLKDYAKDEGIYFLDIAAGTGILVSKILERLPENIREKSKVEVTDFAPGMVDAAKSSLNGNPAFAKVEKNFQVMDAQTLSFADNTFTHLGCQFGIIFVPNRASSLSEMHRVLVPGGSAVIGTWNHSDNRPLLLEFSDFLGLKEEDIAEGREAMDKVLQVCSEPETLEDELRAAGFSHVSTQLVENTFSLPNDEYLWKAFSMNAAMKWATGGPDNYPQWQEFLKTSGSKWINEEGRITIRGVAVVGVATK